MGKSFLMSMIMILVVSIVIFFSCAPLSTTTVTTTTTATLPLTTSTITTNSDTISTIPTTHTTSTIPTTANTTGPTTPLSTITSTISTRPPLNTIPEGSIHIERVFPNLSFKDMTNLVQPDDASGLLFITEQRGVVYAFHSDQPQLGAYVFLDITDRVNQGGSEEGLLGLVFDPDYRENGYFYVYYSATNPRRSVVSRFSLDQGNPVIAAPQSEVIIMEVEQPFSNHNGGQLAFGLDGYLYIGLGDGGGAGDPQHNGQNMGALLGKILRIDVSQLLETGNYRIPSDNPFVNTAGARAEIWAFGLRNPWRFSFDKETGLLWAGDVGQNIWEEIDIIIKGANYGWNVMEGFHCYSPATGCDKSGITLPLVEYDHSQGCSVTGGYVYRGDKVPSLQGFYVYGDYCSGNIWALAFDGNTVTQNILLVESGLSITSFGEDLDRNLYILSSDGGIYTIQ
jgi:glucose/arabinose dehydrogenase